MNAFGYNEYKKGKPNFNSFGFLSSAILKESITLENKNKRFLYVIYITLTSETDSEWARVIENIDMYRVRYV